MKRIVQKHARLLIGAMLITSISFTSCNGQKASRPVTAKKTITINNTNSDAPFIGPMPNPRVQISRYIRRMFQDKAGNIWFGTNGEGVCRFDGANYDYFSSTDLRSGFPGDAVRGIIQDGDGNLWFATDNGVSCYDGKRFKNFNVHDGLRHRQVWSILQDRSGTLWFGTEGGVSRYDGKTFTDFYLPEADLNQRPQAYPAAKLINNIFQDKVGNIWFASNGNGVYRYDGKSVVNFSQADGLCDNFVQCTIQDRQGDLWFATRFGGVSRFDGKSFVIGSPFTTFDQKDGLGNNFAWIIFEDKIGNLWIGNAGGGLTRYDGKTFKNFSKAEGLLNNYVQSILEDKDGTLWIGTSGGAFQFDGNRFINITRDLSKDGC